MAGHLGQALAQPVAFGVFNLAAKEAGREFVALIAHNQIPIGLGQFELQLLIPGQFVQPGDEQRQLSKDIAAAGRFDAVIG